MAQETRSRNAQLAPATASRVRRAAGQLEDEILAALWCEPEAMTAALVQAAIGGQIAYTTVLTVLSRLFNKGVVERTKVGRAYAYRPRVDPNMRVAEQMHRLLERRTDRATVLAHFVEGLSRKDESVLRRLVGRP